MRGDDVKAGDLSSGFGTVVAAYDVEAQVEARGESRRGKNVAFVDVKNVGYDIYLRKGFCKASGSHPVGSRPPPVKQAGVGESKRADTDRHHAGTTIGGG